MCGVGEEGLAVNGWCGCFTLDQGVYVIYGWRVCAHAHIGLICHL